MRDSAIVVLDCGATNLRAVAVGEDGRLLSESSRRNGVVPQAGREDLGIWDLDSVWSKLCSATREVVSDLAHTKIAGVIVATWGADGAPVAEDGSLTYPVISWQCSRTEALAREAMDSMEAWEVYKTTGYQIMAINTLFKLIWLRRNAPEALDQARYWLMMPGLIASRFGADPHIDPTSASTSMALDLAAGDWSSELLGRAELGPEFFPRWGYPGEVVGEVSRDSSKASGLPEGTPVLAGGHDTQFALLGSGAGPHDAVLSSGTWEILAYRSPRFEPTLEGLEGGLIFEMDAIKGFYDPQILMMGSGVLEWVRDSFFADLDKEDYGAMIEMGRGVPAGSDGVMVLPAFVSDSGPARGHGTRGTILGLQLATGREHIYRATLEGLCCQLRQALGVLTTATGETPKGIRVVGGGSRNELWNRIRADVTGLPVTTTSHKEATVLGAALVGFTGVGRFGSVESALEGIQTETRTCYPGEDAPLYDAVYEKYVRIPPALEPSYRFTQRD